MICEICGKDVPRTFSVEIEGATMKTCKACAKFGTPVKDKGKGSTSSSTPADRREVLRKVMEKRERMKRGRDIYEDIKEEIVGDYPDMVRRARNQQGMTREELAKKINEKESVIAKVESGNMLPDESLRKKLERTLHLKLTQEISKKHVTNYHDEDEGMTLGDWIIKDEKK